MKKLLVIAAVMLCAFSACKKEELPQGSFEAKFSISDHRQVTFSKGNLQYNVAEKYWRFAEHQYDFIGLDNENIGTSDAEWIDLFGWGTSCYLQGAKCYVPGDCYKPKYDMGTSNLNYQNGADWGINRIVNGGDKWDMWHTLNDQEWEYILHFRKNADKKCAQATISGVRGLVILPDEWKQPDGVNFTTEGNGWCKNSYAYNEWQLMETAGAVFLPAGGFRWDREVLAVEDNGRYWTASGYNYGNANAVLFTANEFGYAENHAKWLGYSVRLVHYCE